MVKSDLITNLEWRYATKKFDSTKKVSESDMVILLESLRLSASSFGLQPWHFVVVTNTKIREELKKVSWNQSQIVDASHLIVLCAKTNVDEQYVKQFINEIATTRNIPEEGLKEYEGMMVGFLKSSGKDVISQWAKKQVYLALGTLLTAAAASHIDACPMEGFDASAYDKILDLEAKGMTAAVLCPVGFRALDDSYASLKKVRFSTTQVFSFVK